MGPELGSHASSRTILVTSTGADDFEHSFSIVLWLWSPFVLIWDMSIVLYCNDKAVVVASNDNCLSKLDSMTIGVWCHRRILEEDRYIVDDEAQAGQITCSIHKCCHWRSRLSSWVVPPIRHLIPVNRGRSPHPAVSDGTYIPTM